MNSADDKHTSLELDFSHCLARQATAGCVDLARLQRTSEGSSKSTGGGRDDIIERRCMWLGYGSRNFVVLRNGTVNAKDH